MRCRWTLLQTMITMTCLMSTVLAVEPIDIGSRRELFVDRLMVERLDGLRLQLHEPRDEGVALPFDQPWEGLFCGYMTVLQHEGKFLLYYRGRPIGGKDGDDSEQTCLAESTDGKTWTRPNVGLYPFMGQSNTNIVLKSAPYTHNFAPMIDHRPGCPPEEKFKALAGILTTGLHLFVSADGRSWRPDREQPVITTDMVKNVTGFGNAFDSQNLAFWSTAEKQYLCYFRVAENKIRRIYRTTSPDMRTWSKPVRMDYERLGQPAPVEHLYTNQTSPYFRAPHLALAIAARFMPGRKVVSKEDAEALKVEPKYYNDTSDAILMSTRGGSTYQREFLGSFIRPGIGLRNWVSRTNYPAHNLVQTGPTELSIYVNQDYAQPTAHARRYSLRLDGFASLHSDAEAGTCLTPVVTFEGRQLHVNFATSAAGGMTIELQTPDGQPIPGYAGADGVELIGNEIDRVVRWKKGSDVSALAGQPVRILFRLRDADLYSFKFE